MRCRATTARRKRGCDDMGCDLDDLDMENVVLIDMDVTTTMVSPKEDLEAGNEIRELCELVKLRKQWRREPK